MSASLHVSAEIIFAGKESCLKLIDSNAQLVVNTQLTDFGGTLFRSQVANDQIQGQSSIGFNNGFFDGGAVNGTFSGVLDPQDGDIIRLSGDHNLSLNGNSVFSPIYVLGTNNVIQGISFFTCPITLLTSSSQLCFKLFGPLNQPVNIAGGTIILGQDLELINAGCFSGSGTINGQGSKLILSQKKNLIDGALLCKNLAVLQLNGLTDLSGSLTFSSSALVTVIDGQNNILDISNTGLLYVASGNKLILKNTIVRGLGDGFGKIQFADASAQLILVGSTLELSSSFTFSYGSVEVRDESSSVITGTNSLGFTGRVSLLLSGVDLVFDSLSESTLIGINADPLCVISAGGGKIVARVKDATGPALLYSHRSNVLLQSEVLTPNRTMSFSLDGSEPIVLDGHGFSLKFPQMKRSVISIEDGQTIILKNVVLDGFYPEHISLGVGSEIVFDDNVHVLLSGDATLSYKLKCTGRVTFVGGGSVLALSRTGGFSIGIGSELRLVDSIITGLSSRNNQIILGDDTSTLSCVDVNLQLDGNYTISTGRVVFSGTKSTIISGPNTLSFEGSGQLVVDGVSLFYDTLASPNTLNIQPYLPDGVNYISLNGGKVRPLTSAEKEGDMLLDLRSNTLLQPDALSLSRRIIFRGQRAFGPAIELDGAGHIIQMPGKVSNVIVIPDGKNVVIKNIVFRDFLPEHISLGAHSTLTFGDGVILQLADDSVLADLWSFSGRALIDGRYKMLDIGTSAQAGLMVQNGGVLKIVNTYLMQVGGEKMKCLDADSKIQLSSSILYLQDDLVFKNGSLEVFGDVTFSGGKSFVMQSLGGFTIKRGAQIYLDSDVSFVYDQLDSSAQGLVFEDRTSRMFLHNANVVSVQSRLHLSQGTIFVDGYSSLNTDGNNSNSSILVDFDVQVKVQVGGTLNISGNIIG